MTAKHAIPANTRTQARPARILLVDDSPTDVMLVTEALEQAKLLNHLDVVEDGAEAMDFLCRRGRHVNAARPDLVLLDLNLPKKDGRAVLAEMKSDHALARIPVVIMTTSRAEADILGAYDQHANCYVIKPLDFTQFAQIVHTIGNFWFSVVALPRATG